MARNEFWQNKSVIVTGASSGIGSALAELAASRNARVGLIARRAEKIRSLAEGIESRGGIAAAEACDVCDCEGMRVAIGNLEQTLGRCDVLIANAGMHQYSPGYDFDTSAANRVFETNVLGAINSIGPVLPHMVERRRGNVVAIASIAGMLGLPEVGVYSASKSALITLMESLRVDLHAFGVKVTTICPGFVDTPMIADHDRRVLKNVLTPEVAAEKIARAVERGVAEYWFPRRTWLMARLARALPFGAYRLLTEYLPSRRRRDAYLRGRVDPPGGQV